jgi:DNA-binding NtrC family response regulator
MTKLPGTILIIEDDKDVLFTARTILRKRFEKVICGENPRSLPSLLKKEDIDVVLLDMNFKTGETSGKEGLYWLEQIMKTDPEVKVLMATAYGDIQLAVESMKLGAVDFLVKPWEREKLLATVESTFQLRNAQRQLNRYRSVQKMMHGEQQLLGNSTAMEPVLETIEKVAATDANVLLLGENGTGKDLVAKIIHDKSHRQDNPYVKVDLGAVSESLFESELFGHVKGAFTDAKEDRPGRFEIASGGTLFLDEIGNLSSQLQSKLLTAIQSNKVNRLGSGKEIHTDVRLICATNKPLYDLVQTDEFRQDLLYRINTVEITIPPLSDRAEDIPVLAHYFLRQNKNKYNKPNLKLGDKALNRLKNYSWPGNVRELKHALERAVIMSEGDTLLPEDFALKKSNYRKKNDQLNVEELEKQAIIEAVYKSKGNMSLASKELGLSRSTLYRKMKKYDI